MSVCVHEWLNIKLCFQVQGATGMTVVAPKFSDTLSQPGGVPKLNFGYIIVIYKYVVRCKIFSAACTSNVSLIE